MSSGNACHLLAPSHQKQLLQQSTPRWVPMRIKMSLRQNGDSISTSERKCLDICELLSDGKEEKEGGCSEEEEGE